MPYTDTFRTLANPITASRRIYYILEPFHSGNIYHPHKRVGTEMCEECEDAIDNRLIGLLQKDWTYHKALRERNELKGKRIIFESGTTKDHAYKSKEIDPFSDMDLLSERKLEAFPELVDEGVDFDNIVFVRVAPWIWPYHYQIRDQNGELVHTYPEIAEPFGTVRRTKQPKPQKGVYKFNKTVLCPNSAKDMFAEEDDDKLNKHCLLNRWLLVSAFANFCRECELPQIVVYAQKTSTYYEIMKNIAEQLEIPFIDLDIMRNVDDEQGICSPKAMDILKNYLLVGD
jgi:hypothetical protein